MSIKLYKMDWSSTSRAVMMACDIFGISTEMIELNIIKEENHTPEFLKKNPVHTIPVLEDGDVILHDSHAMLSYLSDTYSKNDTWYPKDVKKRALVDQKLFLDAAILFPRLKCITYPAAVEGVTEVSKKQFDDLEETYTILEAFLSRTKYLAGDNITIADISAFATISTSVYVLPLDEKKYPKMSAWIKDLEKQPYSQKYNEAGARGLGEAVKKLIG